MKSVSDRNLKSNLAMAIIIAVLCFASTRALAQTYTTLYTLGTDTNDPINPSPIGLMSQGRDGRVYTTQQYG